MCSSALVDSVQTPVFLNTTQLATWACRKTASPSCASCRRRRRRCRRRRRRCRRRHMYLSHMYLSLRAPRPPQVQAQEHRPQAQANSTQLERVNSSQAKPSQAKSSQLKPSPVNSSQVHSSPVNSSQVHQVHSSQTKPSQVKSSQASLAPAPARSMRALSESTVCSVNSSSSSTTTTTSPASCATRIWA